MNTEQAETEGNKIVQLILREQRAIQRLRWVLVANTEDLEQWRNGEDAARFVNDLERQDDLDWMGQRLVIFQSVLAEMKLAGKPICCPHCIAGCAACGAKRWLAGNNLRHG